MRDARLTVDSDCDPARLQYTSKHTPNVPRNPKPTESMNGVHVSVPPSEISSHFGLPGHGPSSVPETGFSQNGGIPPIRQSNPLPLFSHGTIDEATGAKACAPVVHNDPDS